MGSNSEGKGFWLVFIVSLFLSPLIGLIVYLLIPKPKSTCTFCGSDKLPNDIFCQGCGKDKKGITKEEYSNRSK